MGCESLSFLPTTVWPFQWEDYPLLHKLIVEYSLSSYDASYLALAVKEQCGLAPLDSRLANAAEAETVELKLK